MTARPFAYRDGVSSGTRPWPVLLDHRNSWLGAEAGVRSQPGWFPKPEPKRVSRRRWKLVLSGMFAAGLAVGSLIGLGVGRLRPARATGLRDRDKGS